MNHAHLRAFHAVATEASFTRGAVALNVTQPTLSGQVKALEARYGVRLFERHGRRVTPTELGRSLLDVTRRLFSLEAEAEHVLTAARALKRGHLRLGADAPYHVMPALADFSRRYPGVRLSLTIGNTDNLLHQLVEHRCDIVVVAEVPREARFFVMPLRRDRLVAFVHRGHPWARRGAVRLEDLAGARLVLREVGSSTRRIFEAAMAERGLQHGEVLEINSREAVREAVAAGLGVGIVAQNELIGTPRLRLLAFEGVELPNFEHVVCLAERRDLRLVHAFLEVAREFAEAGKDSGATTRR